MYNITMKEKLTIGKLKKFLEDNSDLSDNVELYYPYYYKGYGLMPVGEIERGKVPACRGDEADTDVVVLDWCTALHKDGCWIDDTRETEKKLDKFAKDMSFKERK